MSAHIVVLGCGRSGRQTANRLRRHCAPGTRITVVDRRDTRDPEAELLAEIGLYGPHALNAPDDLRLFDGIEFRHVEAASVELGRHEVCLMDGTTVPYDALVVATGRHRPADRGPEAEGRGASCVARSAGLGDRDALVRVDAATGRSRTERDVYAVGGAASGPAASGPSLQARIERTAQHLSRLTCPSAPGPTDPVPHPAAGAPARPPGDAATLRLTNSADPQRRRPTSSPESP
ncbi:FAD-dependent oxidoreductase [Streptomyces sp. NPDC020917]|uniref:FAD-dependent oxidoreductase n=1 Tax=Streptomyces sp. NPDC020917 TaxID=3365102 RepID=UPI00379CFC02